jgi:hypothetical protein
MPGASSGTQKSSDIEHRRSSLAVSVSGATAGATTIVTARVADAGAQSLVIGGIAKVALFTRCTRRTISRPPATISDMKREIVEDIEATPDRQDARGW